MQHDMFSATTSGGTLYWNDEPYEIVGPGWIQTAEISPWERTVSASCSADDLSRLSSRIEWLEHRVEKLMKQLEEIGLTDVSDLI